MNRREKCPGSSDWAIDDFCWLGAGHLYFCKGCGRYFKIAQRGRTVGLVPYHRRYVAQAAFAPYMNQQFPEALRS